MTRGEPVRYRCQRRAIKWVVEEEGTREALILLEKAKLSAPDLLVPECANVLWKKVHRNELSAEEAILSARLLEVSEIEPLPTRSLLEAATRMAIDVDHPAYDCLYLVLAVSNDCRFVTADEHLRRKLAQTRLGSLRERVTSLPEAGV